MIACCKTLILYCCDWLSLFIYPHFLPIIVSSWVVLVVFRQCTRQNSLNSKLDKRLYLHQWFFYIVYFVLRLFFTIASILMLFLLLPNDAVAICLLKAQKLQLTKIDWFRSGWKVAFNASLYLVVTCFALLWQMFIVVNDFSLHSHLNPFALTLTLHSFYCWLLSLALTYYCIMLNLFYLFCFDYIIRWTMKTVISLISTYVWLLSRSKLFSKYIYYRTRVHKHIAFWLLNYLELSVFKSSTEPLSFWQWNRL